MARVSTSKTEYSVIGKSLPRPDGWDKVTGKAEFSDDIQFAHCLTAVIKTANVPHAEILSIDTSEAEKIPGVHAVITAKDIPGENQVGVIIHDQPCIADKKVRYRGEGVAVVAADSREIAEEACKKIKVEYKELPGIFTAKEGFADKIQRIHEKTNIATSLKIRKGDVSKAWEKADVIIEDEYHTHHQEHAYIETLGCAAVPGKDGSITIYGSMQCPFYVQKAVSTVMGLPYSKVRVIQTATGGAFGGKEDVPSEFCSKAAILAQKTGRPVKIILTREEDIYMTSKRHPFDVKVKIGATKDGKLIACEVLALADAGAFATLSPVVIFRATIHAAGTYVIPNVHVDVYGVYTNNMPSGAFRGFGSPQVHFAIESIMDQLAEKLNMDPIDLRLKNALKVGSRTCTNQLLKESVGLVETIDLARKESHWNKKRKELAKHGRNGNQFAKGIGVAVGWYGNSLGSKGWYLDGAGANVQLLADGTATVAIGGTELGQGATVIASQIAGETLGLAIEKIQFLTPDTSMVPDSGPTVASRTTTISGGAVLNACRELVENITPTAAKLLKCKPADVRLKEGKVYSVKSKNKFITHQDLVKECYSNNIHLAAQGWFLAPKVEWDMETGLGEPYYAYSFMTHIAEVEVDRFTGQVKVEKITAVHDIGTVINPKQASGQVEGGLAQGVGYSVYETFKIEKGIPKTRNFTTYIIPTALDVPEINVKFVECQESHGPFGAKSLGEPPIIPIGAAIANAVYNATGVRVKELPISAEVMWKYMQEAGKI